MAEIDVILLSDENEEKSYKVVVSEEGTQTEHEVTVRRRDHERMTRGEMTEEELLKASFEFLLDRESKESILPTFDLMLIAKYFPEYEKTIMDL